MFLFFKALAAVVNLRMKTTFDRATFLPETALKLDIKMKNPTLVFDESANELAHQLDK